MFCITNETASLMEEARELKHDFIKSWRAWSLLASGTCCTQKYKITWLENRKWCSINSAFKTNRDNGKPYCVLIGKPGKACNSGDRLGFVGQAEPVERLEKFEDPWDTLACLMVMGGCIRWPACLNALIGSSIIWHPKLQGKQEANTKQFWKQIWR